MTVLLVYIPQAGLNDSVKDLTKIGFEILFVCGDFNGHIGKNADRYEGVHGYVEDLENVI